MLKNGSKYYFTKLTDGEKNLYTHITQTLDTFEPALSVHAGMGQDFALDMERILTAVFFDNPGYFYLDRHRIVIKRTPMYLQLCFQYDYTRAEAEAFSREIKDKIVAFMCEAIEPDMTPLQKQLAVYQFLQRKVTLQTDGLDRDSYSVIGALVRGACVCEGLAKAYKLLCDYLRLASMVVTGQALRGDARVPHAWNIIRLNNITAHCDVTWDTVAGPGAYDYFNLCDADMAADHIFDAALYPPCNPNRINYFHKNNLIAANEAEAKRMIVRHADSEFFSVKLLFPMKRDGLAELGFPAGTLRFNETQHVVMWRRG